MKEVTYKKLIQVAKDNSIPFEINLDTLSFYDKNKNLVASIEYDKYNQWYVWVLEADTDYWNSSEFTDLDTMVEIIISRLLGNYKIINNEIFFAVSNGWVYTKTRGEHKMHYLKFRKNL